MIDSGPGPDGARDPSLRVEDLRQLPVADARRRLRRLVVEELARFVHMPPDEIADRDHLVDLGFDSLMAVDFKLAIEKRLGHPLRTTLLFDYPTPSSMVEFLVAELLAPAVEGSPIPGPCVVGVSARDDDLDGVSVAELRDLVRLQRDRLGALERSLTEPIAVIGMACRFPGAPTADDFWRLQVEGRDAITDIPADRFPVEALYDPDRGAPGKMYVRTGGFIDAIDRFDAAFFGISPVEATQLDPQQRILLEITWAALEDAALSPDELTGTDTGVFIGCKGSEYFDSQTDRTPADTTSYYATGNAVSTAAGRISYVLGLTGPCFALDTACSASLVAIHQGVLALRRGDSSVAIAGGVSLIIDPINTVAVCQAGMLAADGRCKTFDASADGYGRSEGCGLVVLKRLADAQRDGDRIHAVIRGSAINQDGASGGLTVPNGPAQESVIRKALGDARVRPDEIDYVETHGTGTALGDPIEVGALDRVLARGRAAGDRVRVGSVKTNIGHLESSAGVAGFIRTVQALRHELLPPVLHLETPNPNVDWDDVGIEVVTRPTPWPRGSRRRLAGVSSFGFSGTNAHLILEEAPAPAPAAAAPGRPAELVPISAKSAAALDALLGRWQTRLGQHDGAQLGALAHTAATGRAHLPHRLALIATDRADLARQLALRVDDPDSGALAPGVARAREPDVAFLYTGQGSQYPEMARGLDRVSPVFRAALDRCAAVFDGLMDVSLRDVLWGSAHDRLGRTDYTQPTLFAVAYALGELWDSLGVRPAVVSGHSVGEYAAACRAGVFSLEDGLRLIAARGRLMVELTRPGAMTAVLADPERIATIVAPWEDRVAVAAHNGPRSVVLSGALDAIAEIERELADGALRFTRLDVSHAFHSPLMEPMLGAFAAEAARVRFRTPDVPMISNLTGGWCGPEIATPDYWVRHARAPVRFVDGMKALAERRVDALLEIGPQPVLLGMARSFLRLPDAAWIASLREGRDDWGQLLEAVGTLWLRGARVDWRALHRGEHRTVVDLPGYPFEPERFWLRRRGRGAAGSDATDHPLLGRRLVSPALDRDRAVFESWLSSTSPSWAGEHRVFERAILPGAAWIEMMAAAALRRSGADGVQLENVSIQVPLALTGNPVRVQTVVTDRDDGLDLRVFSEPLEVERNDDPANWTVHVTAHSTDAAGAAEPPATDDPERVRERLRTSVDPARLYASYRDIGLDYGPSFRGIGELVAGPHEALARIRVGPLAGEAGDYALHPALLDACFQTAAAVLPDEANEAWLPVAVERFLLRRVGAIADLICHTRLRGAAGALPTALTLDFRLTDQSGAEVARIDGLRLVKADRSALLRRRDTVAALLHGVEWIEAPARAGAPAAARARSWLVVGAETPLSEALVRELDARGAVVRRVVAEGDLAAGEADDTPRTVVELRATESSRGAETVPARAARLVASGLDVARVLTTPGAAPTRLIVVTRGSQPIGAVPLTDPAGATLWGFGATLRLEHPELESLVLDLDPSGEDDAATEARVLVDEVLAPSGETWVGRRHGRTLVGRLRRSRDARGAGHLAIPPGADGARLRAREYGSLGNLELVPVDRREPGSGEVAIAVAAAALNFKDVLHVLGLLREWSERDGILTAREQPLGFECAGVVTAVGPDVANVKPGDAVLVGAAGALATSLVVPAAAVTIVPHGLDAVDAAAIQTVFLTALHALERLARIGPRDRVLIHAATGGVGQAAIQVARRAGCEIFATASQAKQSHLLEQGIAHVYDSRTTEFADALLRDTSGAGVDVVLNCLTGDALARSFDVLAVGGRFVEIGKIGIKTPEEVAALRPDASYFAFDLGDDMRADPGLQRSLLDEVVSGFCAGTFAPLPKRTFPLTDAVAAFTHLAQAKHVGKVVVTMPRAEPERVGIRGDRTYLITGGLGALGRTTARWLIECGARTVVLAGRRTPDADAERALDQLRSSGADVRALAVDVADRDDLATKLEDLRRALPPLGGVIHAAGVLDDGLIANLDRARLECVLRPKTEGAWNLHELTATDPLDHFVLFSSLAAVLGNPGQASYAAANAFLDALAHHRRALGKPATSINWGPWSGGGMASRVAAKSRARLAEVGLSALDPETAVVALGDVLGQDAVQVGVFRLDWTRYAARQRGPRRPFLEAVAPRAAAATTASDIVRELAAAPSERRRGRLREYLAEQVARAMGFASGERLQADESFAELGVDSLIAVDLRNRLETSFGRTLPATLLFDCPDLSTLTAHLAPLVLPDERAAAAQPAPAAGPGPDDTDGLAELSEDELARRLAEEIRASSDD